MNASKYVTAALFIFILTTAWCMDMSAKNKKVPKLYIFGMAASFNDSTVYFTDIQEVDSVWINAKNKFLINRNEYSHQLKDYLEGRGMSRRTCIVSFALKRKNAQKKYNKMKNKYLKKGTFDMRDLDRKDFSFTSVSMEE